MSVNFVHASALEDVIANWVEATSAQAEEFVRCVEEWEA